MRPSIEVHALYPVIFLFGSVRNIESACLYLPGHIDLINLIYATDKLPAVAQMLQVDHAAIFSWRFWHRVHILLAGLAEGQWQKVCSEASNRS